MTKCPTMSCTAFQALPSTIIRQVLEFYRIAPCTPSEPISLHKSCPLLPIAATCSAWRSVALYTLCNNVGLDLSGPDYIMTFIDDECHKSLLLPNYYAPYIRYVFMRVDMHELLCEEASVWLESIASKRRCFNVHKIEICITFEGDQTVPIQLAHEQLNTFIAAFRKMFPALQQAHVWFMVKYKGQSKHWNMCPLLVNDMIHGIKNITLTLPEFPALPTTPIVPFTGLTSFMCIWDNHHDNTARLIHMNSASLCMLQIKFETLTDIAKLFSGGSQPVIFKVLRRLVFLKVKELTYEAAIVPCHHNPFPVLEDLFAGIPYQLILEYILQWDYGMLKQLTIDAAGFGIATLKAQKKLSKKWLMGLVAMKIPGQADTSDVITSDMHTLADIINNSSNLYYLHIEDNDMAMAFMSGMGQPFASLTCLSLHSSDLDLMQVFSLLPKLPALYSLDVSYIFLGKKFLDMQVDQVLEYANINHNPLHTGLKSLRVGNLSGLPAKELLACMLIITAVCVNMRTIRFNTCYFNPGEMLETALKSNLYSLVDYKICQLFKRKTYPFWQIDRVRRDYTMQIL